MANSNTESGFVDNWQRGKSVPECNLHMLETEDFTDVTFLVGSEKHVVRAHRYVLASRSCVFHAMFCGSLAEQREITIPDIEVHVFKDFLSLLEQSHGYGETGLEEKALKMLREANIKVTTSPKFLELCSHCFDIFLKSDELNLQEAEIFEATLSWIKAECSREGLSPSHENMRKILGEMLYEIRFASLSLEFLTKVVGPSGVLSDGERVKIMDMILDTNVDITPFKSSVRNSFDTERVDIRHVNRFDSTHRRTKIMKYQTHAILFSTNKNITLLGCKFYGSETSLQATLTIQLYDDKGSLISNPRPHTDCMLSNYVNDVMFPDPVPIQAELVYTICTAVPPGTDIEGFWGRRLCVCEDHVEFKFMVSDYGSYSSAKFGQIPGLIWKL